MNRHDYPGATVSRPFQTKAQARRAGTWLRNHGVVYGVSFKDREIWAPVTKHGPEWTINAIEKALAPHP